MFESLTGLFSGNSGALIFYAILILIIYANRHKLEWQGIAGLYKTQVGVKLMQKIADKYTKLVRWLGYAGIPVGFIGMALIMVMMLKGLWDIVHQPEPEAVFSLVIPGISVDGLFFGIPLIIGWLALFVVITVHEFSHGVVSKAHKIPVESSGLLFFGPLLGAFVEPNEKKLVKAKDGVQLSIFAAGPFSNVLAAIVFSLVLAFALAPALGMMTEPAGILIPSVTEGLPADLAGIQAGTVIVGVHGQETLTPTAFATALGEVKEGDTITLVTSDEQEHSLVAVGDDDPATDAGVIGIQLQAKHVPVNDSQGFLFLLNIAFWLKDFFYWVIVLNIGIGLANLLPLGPVDGGRMVQTATKRLFGKKLGHSVWKNLSWFTFILLLAVLLLPFLKGLF